MNLEKIRRFHQGALVAIRAEGRTRRFEARSGRIEKQFPAHFADAAEVLLPIGRRRSITQVLADPWRTCHLEHIGGQGPG